MRDILDYFGLAEKLSGCGWGAEYEPGGVVIESRSPIDSKLLGKVKCGNVTDVDKVVRKSIAAFEEWRLWPAPKRGEVVRLIGEELRTNKRELGALVTLEMGKLRTEGEGEVQEMIDIGDFAVGLSRMLHGLTMHSERPGHRMYEQYHPLGPVAVITAFNFPVAVWAWNAMLSLVCGDPVIWKPSPKTPLCALAVMKLVWKVLDEAGAPEGLASVIVGERDDVGAPLVADGRVPLVSATGSVTMGRRVAEVVGARLGRVLLELGGNNGIIVTPESDLELAVRAVVFGAVGTAGQRCTTTRRLIVHSSRFDEVAKALVDGYRQVRIGDPLEEDVLMGPLIDECAAESMRAALKRLEEEGGEILYGGERLAGAIYDTGAYVTPCIAKATPDMRVVREETFAPILYLMSYEDLAEAICMHNDVPQGLSSAIFTDSVREAEVFLSHAGSDCGIANVNIGTSGAEIGGAFGGEKETGGGREAGSDAWKVYMRRQTCTLNWSGELPLAQGIKFKLG